MSEDDEIMELRKFLHDNDIRVEIAADHGLRTVCGEQVRKLELRLRRPDGQTVAGPVAHMVALGTAPAAVMLPVAAGAIQQAVDFRALPTDSATTVCAGAGAQERERERERAQEVVAFFGGEQAFAGFEQRLRRANDGAGT
jgi:hypothetical protein